VIGGRERGGSWIEGGGSDERSSTRRPLNRDVDQSTKAKHPRPTRRTRR
jgi:hypothetical protein